MGAVQALIPVLKSTNNEVLQQIIFVLTIIIKKGWKQIIQLSTSSSQNDLQQQLLLNLVHPYLDIFEQHQIMKLIVEDILMNEVDIMLYNESFQLFYALYPDGLNLPYNFKEQFITKICRKGQNNDINSSYFFQFLAYLALNAENHQFIIVGGVIQTVFQIMRGDIFFYFQEIQYSLQLLLHLYTFGSSQTKESINNSISNQLLNELRKNSSYDNKVKQLLSSFVDVNTINELLLIKRAVEIRDEEQLFDLIKAGLMTLLLEYMNKAIQCQDEGQMISIGNIIKSLTEGNPKVCRLINDETDFIQQYLQLLNSISKTLIKQGFIQPLLEFSYNIILRRKQKLYSNDIILFIQKILYYDDITVVTCAVWIISYIVKAELEELEDGAQNPLHQQLTDNGTILQLITIFKDKDNKPNHIVESIAEVLAYLFKALPLPQDIDKEIIKQLKNEINFNELALLAECPDNHKAILHDCYELELFNDEDLIGFSLQQLNLVKNILKYGSFSNKKKVALAIKVKIENLINQSDIYFDDEEDDWDIKVSKQAKQVLSLIISVEEQIEEQGEYEEMNATQINTKKNDDDEEEDIDQLFNKIYNMDNIEEDEEEEEDNDDDEIDEIQQIINIQFYESQLNQSKRRKLNDD